MYGVVTRNAEEASWSAFDVGCYEVKDVSGRASEPVEGAVNTLSTFADNAAARDDPGVVPVNDAGERATRDRPYFDWSYVCPTHPEYREGLLEIVEDCAAVAPDVRLDDVGFPREGYCRCERCERLFAESDREDRLAWRADVVTEFVAAARERVPGDLYLAVHPDPYPGHLSRRAGVALGRLVEHVDEFVVPLYDTAYGTTYWLESLAKGFRTALAGGDPDGTPATPFAVELYAVDVDVDALVDAADVAGEYADDVFFGYDASTATAALRRMRADAREGVTHRPDDG
ncbi:MAG: hypothetical protein ABEJ61_10045 [Haloferacaceae archaeon]